MHMVTDTLVRFSVLEKNYVLLLHSGTTVHGWFRIQYNVYSSSTYCILESNAVIFLHIISIRINEQFGTVLGCSELYIVYFVLNCTKRNAHYTVLVCAQQ